MPTLISLLGKGRNDSETGYRKASYRFADGTLRETPFFGLALAEQIQPGRLVVAGTAGSMWDVLLQQHAAEDDTVLQLMEAVEKEAVTQQLLTACESHLSQQLGRPVTCLLIPYARNEDEQVAILQALALKLSKGEKVVLDVTHGFRHLPMLALVAARYLARVQQVQVEEVYYGALEMTDQQGTPVLALGSMLQMLDWVEALATYDKDGDYGVFAPLLAADGMDRRQAAVLQQAAFYERTGNPVQAQQKLGSVIESVKSHSGALGRLFRDTLARRISWFRKGNRSEWERALGNAYLERGDYLRAATYLYESSVTLATLQQGWGDINDFAARKDAFKDSRNEHSQQLEYLRNSLCHGVRPLGDNTAAHLQSEERLRKRLQELSEATQL
ncbi:TIGR02221 family CRISPR-associated protein [Azotobacter salinestris]|uniref:TIGR02221 family CRISPR-associated protein n=1 Tax=Azotobacter salinestris TaxID=69964 RepID=UPI0032DE77B1